MRNVIMTHYPKVGNFMLIIISYALYIKWEPIYALLLLGITAITFIFALLIEKEKAYGKKKYLIYSGIILASFPLVVFKYYNFIATSLSDGLSALGITVGLPGLNWAMPLGISFFTLQAIGYLADVYLKRIKAEHDWWDYMLFVSFFPQIASGPISKAKDLLPQIKSNRSFDSLQFVAGCRWLLWGMFLKVTVADRLGTIVSSIYNTYIYQDGMSCFLASILYSFQIYSDFAGYSFMAMGVGKILGFNLINNFNRPYFSISVTDFWHRWHISLSTWLKDYIYIPLGGNRCSKARNYFNIFVTFIVSGIWHGANWTFIFWGALHGLYQIIEKIFGLSKKESHGIIKFVRVIFTFILVDIAWIFFRMPTFSDAYHFISKFTTISNLNLSVILSYKSLLFPFLILLLKDFIDEFLPQYSLFHSKYLILRWLYYIILIVMILLWGIFDASQFIYVNF